MSHGRSAEHPEPAVSNGNSAEHLEPAVSHGPSAEHPEPAVSREKINSAVHQQIVLRPIFARVTTTKTTA